MQVRKALDIQKIADYLKLCGPETKIYLGCDSERLTVNGKWYADYTLAVVIHVDGNKGCKIFGQVDRELDYDQKKDKPSMRLMNEVYRVADLFHKLDPLLHEFHVEVHLDINPNEIHGSSCVLNQAIGYIKGTCNVIPLVKPQAFAASCAADRLKELQANGLAKSM